MSNKFYITTTLPYVNAKPHIGFALEIVQADAIARFHQLQGEEVVFNTGTDEHGVKIYRNATEAGVDPQEYVDKNAAEFDKLKQALNLSYTNFIRTSEEHHKKAAQEFWNRCLEKGDIEKKTATINYCSGCELEKTASELVDDHCPIHPNLELETIEEENYFFKFSNYQQPLLDFYKENPDFVVPSYRFNEIKQFVEDGLKDFSISRLKSKMPWGVPVPGDDEHVMYVWFDALVNYISTLGWPEDEKNFKAFWPGMQVAGKDNLRQQSAMWQAMLLSAELPTSKQVLIHGFISSGGQKMSKSLGNVIDPLELVEKYGTDAVRYFLLRHIHPFEDSDFTIEKFEESYNADLANGLGNVVNRVAGLIEQNNISVDVSTVSAENMTVSQAMDKFSFDQALKAIWEDIAKLDGLISEQKPWEMAKDEAKRKDLEKVLQSAAEQVVSIAAQLKPFLPQTAEKVVNIFNAEKITKGEVLFPRLD